MSNVAYEFSHIFLGHDITNSKEKAAKIRNKLVVWMKFINEYQIDWDSLCSNEVGLLWIKKE